MKKLLSKLFAVVMMSGIAVYAQNENVTFSLSFASNGTFNPAELKYGWKVDAQAGLDGFDVPFPPPFVGGSASFNADLFDTKLSEDFRQKASSIVWQLDVVQDVDGNDVTMTWDDAAFPVGYTARLIPFPIGTGTAIDMTAANTHTFTSTSSFLIVVAEDTVTNNPPIARNDRIIGFSADIFPQGQDPAPVVIDVLLNDFDPDGDNLTITQVNSPSTQNGTADIDGTTVKYTPVDNTFTGLDSFTYTVSDDGAPVLSHTATVSIHVFEGDVIAVRNHADRAKAGDAADAGLVVAMEILISSAAENNLTFLSVTETLPIADNVSIYKVAAGSHTTGFDITGANADLITGVVGGDGNTRDVTFTIDTNNLPLPSPLQFSYRIVGDVNDRTLKTLTGIVEYEIDNQVPYIAENVPRTRNKISATADFTTFEPVEALFHPADTTAPFGRMSDSEKNSYFSRVTLIVKTGFQTGGFSSDGYDYFFEGGVYKPGADPSGGGPSQIHPADTDSNGKISDSEKNSYFSRVTLIVKTGFQTEGFNPDGYLYHFDNGVYKPGAKP